MLTTFLSRRVFGFLAMTSRNTISWNEVKELEDNLEVLLVDVREPKELEETGIIPGSINIPLNTLQNVLQNLSGEEFEARYGREKPKNDTPLVFTCRSGNRSGKAYDLAVELGYTNLRNYTGGWLDWEKRLRS